MLYVLDSSLNIIGICENITSIIWTNRYYEHGDFEILVPATQQHLNLLCNGTYVVREGKETNAMIITALQLTTDIENGNTILVKGKCLKSILTRRIVWQQTNVSGTIENCVFTLLDENIMSPSDPNRRIENFVYNPSGTFTETMSAQFTGDNLYDVILDICKQHKIGFDVSLDLEHKQFVFQLYVGEDRSYNQTKNPRIEFSNEFGNLLTTIYTSDASEFKNAAKIAGEGEGLERKYAAVGNASGINRYELFIDSRNTSTNNGEISEEDYTAMLTNDAIEELTKYDVIETFEGEVEIIKNYQFGVDYFIGDTVQIVNEYGMQASAMIVEVIESEDESGTYTIPTFSTWSQQ